MQQTEPRAAPHEPAGVARALNGLARRVVRATLGALGVALLASPASAQEQNPQFFPVGERAMGLGGAYSAHAGDASAVYYGAGGLVFGRVSSVQATLPLRLVDRYVLEGAVLDEGFDLEYRDGIGLPIYVGGAVRFGERASDGAGRHALAGATFEPIRSRRRFALHEDRAGGGGDGLSVRRDDIVRWYGVSYAYRALDELGIGASLFLATRSFVHEEGGLSSPGAGSFSARSTFARMNAEALIVRIAAHLELDPTFSLALTIQPPGWEIGARGSLGSARGVAGPDGVTTDFEARDDVPVRTPIPWQIRAGLAWRPSIDWVVTFDAALVGPVGSESNPVTRFDVGSASEGAFGRYLETQWWGEPVFDVALGGRVTIAEHFGISAGFFTNLSSAPSMGEGPFSTYRPDQNHLFGASLALSYRSEGVDIAAGLVGSLGFGRGLRAIEVGAATPVYEATDVRSQSLYLFISGAGRAGRLIREITDDLLREMAPGDADEIETESDAEQPETENDAEHPGTEADADERETETDAEQPETETESDAEQPETETESDVERPETESESDAEQPETESESDVEQPETESENDAEELEIENEAGEDEEAGPESDRVEPATRTRTRPGGLGPGSEWIRSRSWRAAWN